MVTANKRAQPLAPTATTRLRVTRRSGTSSARWGRPVRPRFAGFACLVDDFGIDLDCDILDADTAQELRQVLRGAPEPENNDMPFEVAAGVGDRVFVIDQALAVYRIETAGDGLLVFDE